MIAVGRPSCQGGRGPRVRVGRRPTDGLGHAADSRKCLQIRQLPQAFDTETAETGRRRQPLGWIPWQHAPAGRLAVDGVGSWRSRRCRTGCSRWAGPASGRRPPARPRPGDDGRRRVRGTGVRRPVRRPARRGPRSPGPPRSAGHLAHSAASCPGGPLRGSMCMDYQPSTMRVLAVAGRIAEHQIRGQSGGNSHHCRFSLRGLSVHY
jgi:hypothetical protein